MLNYDYAYLDFNYIQHFQHRHLMIFDEAHNLESKIMQKLEFSIQSKLLRQFFGYSIPAELINKKCPYEWINFLKDIYNEYNKISVNISKNNENKIISLKLKVREL